MECASRLEGTNSLEVLALEEESNSGVCGGLAFEWCSNQRFGGLRRGCDGIKCFAGQQRRAVHIGLDEAIRRLYSGWRQGLSSNSGRSHCGM